MKVLTVLFLFVSSLTYSQNKVQVKSKISIDFEAFTDTVFVGYTNIMTLKGISDMKGITVEGVGASISVRDKSKKQYNLISHSNVLRVDIIVKRNKKEIYRKIVVNSVLKGEQLEYLKKKNLPK